ncbi:ATP-dependent Clp protease ATP-binding subunit [uncultured Dysosmobacter sp.]|uniref:ATP-dependent Clp protease ATP-binding subunit n=1 Tax=uncultured Dysosmobacter sp. TaxID=2591384 RepID=UPI00262670D3|nr:ATP-dependent Clp protease ATP-binding subunit [uncultured Dysosmobacter sp.]
MNENKFTPRAEEALRLSQEAAGELGHGYVGTEHLLLGLIREDEGLAHEVLTESGLTDDMIVEIIKKSVGAGLPGSNPAQGLTPRAKRVVEIAMEDSMRGGYNYVGTEHLLAGVLREGNNMAVRILRTAGVDARHLYTALMQKLNETPRGKAAEAKAASTAREDNSGKNKTLKEFTRDLTADARAGKLDPVIGRDNEIQRVIQILSRRTKNNPCLIGEPGVGKTAIAEGLARKIVMGDVPDDLLDKKILSLDLSGMVAGTKYRGEFEERIKKALEEVKKSGDIILFIDELHTIVGAGSAEGAVDAANIIKPALGRGEIRVVGATTLNEYRKYIEKDAALERRFQPVQVGEPSQEASLEILRGLRAKYEQHHQLQITDEALEAAVSLSSRYINDRFLPDKAIDLMDEAASRVRMEAEEISPELKSLEEKIAALAKDKEAAIAKQDYETAAQLRDIEKNYQDQVEIERDKRRKNHTQHRPVTAEDIAAVVSGWTGIPVTRLTEDEGSRLLRMEDILHERVVGQNEAVQAVARAIRRGRVGLKDPKRPIGSFLFLGPTGVGKTELCKSLAEAMFGDENAMIRIDMSEYMERHTVSRLIGSPPGYVGHDEGGQLTEKVRRKPYSVVLFDEIEKAHEDVWNVLLQILDDGRITDSQGRTVDFKNTVIVMTSNIGAKSLTTAAAKLGFSAEERGTDPDAERKFQQAKETVMAELRQTFRPEFLNRIDDIIVFRSLTEKDIEEVARRMLKTVSARMETMGIHLDASDEAVAELAKEGFDPKYGARPLRRAIQSKVEDAVAEKMLDGTLAAGDTAKLTVENDRLCVSK